MGHLRQRLGQYDIIEKIDEGGVAQVYKAFQSNLNRYVAIKVLSPLLVAEPGFTQSFQQEAQALAQLDHPHILPIYDYGIQDNTHYLVMRYVPGSNSLARVLKQDAPIDCLLDYVIQVAEALQHAHNQRFVHQDVKPANILIDGKYALLSDFGLVLDIRTARSNNNPGFGTPAYMAPEQLNGGVVDHRADIYSLGVILYQILTNSMPPPLSQRRNHLPRPRPQLSPDITDRLSQITMRAMSLNTVQRFSSAADLNAALRLVTHS